MHKYVIYTRVSTEEQGRSGLGLEAQMHACQRFVEQRGTVLAHYSEVHTGTDDNRPELAKALNVCQRARAVLVVLRLDRLGRNVSHLAGLIETQALVCVENEHASEMELHFQAVFAQRERAKIADRTREALAAAKRRGTLLGSARPGHWSGRESVRLEALSRGTVTAAKNRAGLYGRAWEEALPVVRSLRSSGAGYAKVAAELNNRGVMSPGCGKWHAASVRRLEKRHEAISEQGGDSGVLGGGVSGVGEV